MGLAQVRQGGADQAHVTHQAQLNRRLPGGVVEVLEFAGGWPAGVGEQQVQPSEGLHGLSDEAFWHSRIGYIASQGDYLAATLIRQSLGGSCQVFSPAAIDGYMATFQCQAARCSVA